MKLRNLPAAARAATMAAATVATIGAAGAAAADGVGDFYKGKTMKIIVGSGPGGGYDLYARTLARHMPEFMPGKPDMIVQNMVGAASIRAANFVYNVAPKDGTVMGAFQRAIAVLPLYGKAGPQYDAQKFNWIGSLNNEVSVCVSWHSTPVKTIEDAKEKELIIGGSGANDTENFPAALNNILGTKFKIVSGYTGTAINLAMERSEVYGRCGWSWTSLKNQHGDWIRDKKINVLVQLSTKKLPEIGDVPLILDLAKDKADREVFQLIFAPQALGRPFVMPPGVPAERVAAARAAFAKAAEKNKLMAELATQKFDTAPVSGAEMQALVAEIYKTPKDVVERARDALVYRGVKKTVKMAVVKDRGTISAVKKGGRELEMKLASGKIVKTSVSGSRTKVTIAGKEAKRAEIKAGMTCTFTYPGSGQRAAAVDCN